MLRCNLRDTNSGYFKPLCNHQGELKDLSFSRVMIEWCSFQLPFHELNPVGGTEVQLLAGSENLNSS